MLIIFDDSFITSNLKHHNNYLDSVKISSKFKKKLINWLIFCVFLGNFSFGSCTKFKSQTIVEFIENAVEYSRSGRYLFFLHRRPTIGPVRVQLLHPVSRFKHTQSLQHLCRFVILKMVRKDLISSLPLPRRMIDYLNTPHYYSEELLDIVETEYKSDNYSSSELNDNNLTPLLQLTPDGFSSISGRTNVPSNVSPFTRQSWNIPRKFSYIIIIFLFAFYRCINYRLIFI